MNSPLVTILLPVYNSVETLQETLDSLWAQTLTDFELLVVDDGSEDGTSTLLAACTDPRLRVLRNPERLRLAGALNRGMKEATAPLIARMDADDLALPERLEVQKAWMDAHTDCAMVGGWTRHFGDRRKSCEKYPVEPDAVRAFSMFNCPFAHPTVMFRRELFLEEGLMYDGSFYPTEDFELWSRVVHRFPCWNIPDVLLNYRVHAASMTGSDWTNMDTQACRLIRAQFAHLGVEISEAESRLHRDIGMARVSLDGLGEAVVWLEDLERRNEAIRFCDPSCWRSELQDRLYHMCMNATSGGKEVLQAFRMSRLWGKASPPRSQLAMLRGSILYRSRRL